MSEYQKLKEIVYGKLIDKTLDADYAELSEILFGEGNCFNSSEVRKRLYGMRTMIEAIERDAINEVNNNEELVKEIEEKTYKLQKERVKLADSKREINKKIREAARREVITEEVIEAIDNISKSKPLPATDNIVIRKGDNAAIIMLSDWHYGLVVENYWNRYNVDILKNRVSSIINQAKAHIESFSVNKLYVVLNGDFINGNIHTTLRIMSEMNVIDQTIGVAELISNTIHELSKLVEEVEVHSSLGNHSRITANIKESLTSENLEKLIYRFIKERLKFHQNVKCLDNQYDDTMVTFNVFNERIFASHGDKDHLNTVVNNMNKLLDTNPTLVLLGHIHHFSSRDFGSATTITGGSLIGMDDFCVNKRIFGKPYQNMLIVNKTLGKIAVLDLKV